MTGTEPRKLQRLLICLMILAGLSMLPYIATYNFRGEEWRRFLVAYEMVKAGAYLQPTVFGVPYFNKPPLFNWIVIASAGITGWNVLAVRLPSLLAVLLTSALVYRFSFRLYRDTTQALLSALIFLTFLDVLYWYGWLGEIDATLALFVSLMIFCQVWYFERQRGLSLVASGVLAGLTFLLKGFVAVVFFAIPLLTLAVCKRQTRRLFSLPAFLSYCSAVVIPLLWIGQISQPGQFLKTLLAESAERVEQSLNVASFLIHLAEYPLLTIKQTLPASFFLLYAIVLGKARLQGTTRMLGLVFIFSYLLFFLAAGSRGRYILPLFPLAAVFAARVILDGSSVREHLLTSFLSVIALFIIGRFLFGFFGLPHDQERRGSPEVIAREVMESIDLSKPTACDCTDQQSICLYMDLYSGRVFKTPSVTRDWQYLVTCGGAPEGEVLKTLKMHNAVVSVRERR